MKKIFCVYLVAVLAIVLSASLVLGFSGSGSGTLGDPYVITNCTQLQEMNDILGANYSLGNNIDCSDTVNWNSGAGFVPIGDDSSLPGSTFSGNFEGNGFDITNLYINRNETDYVGLFGYVLGANVSNVNLVDVNITGYSRVGGLMGILQEGVVVNSSARGNVTSKIDWAGGLIGYSEYSVINNSYSTGRVFGRDLTGGLVGSSYESNLSSSYSSSEIIGGAIVGGLVGDWCGGKVSNSYSRGFVHGTNDVGGLAGDFYCGAILINSYSVGLVNASTSTNIGGLIGWKQGGTNISNSFYDTNTSNRSDNVGKGVPQTTEEMLNYSNFINAGWNFDTIWDPINDTIDYPVLQWQIEPGPCEGISAPTADEDEDGYIEVTSCCELQLMNENLTANYELNNTIDCSDTVNWNDGAGFVPIGDCGEDNACWGEGISFEVDFADNNPFTGNLYGNNYNITSLYINNNTLHGTGLFGLVVGPNDISNVNLVDVNITGHMYTGGFVGMGWGGYLNLSGCSISGRLFGEGDSGGLIGFANLSNIEDSHNDANIYTNGTGVGGLIGKVYYDSNISNSYNAGNITSDMPLGSWPYSYAGGLVGDGANAYRLTIIDSYNLGTIIGDYDSVGGLVSEALNAIITGSYNTGDITGVSNVGGLAGALGGGEITSSNSTGNITGYTYIGGLAGYSNGNVSNSFATGAVNANDGYVGGLIGYFSEDGVLNNSYATGNVSGNEDVGGLVGKNEGNITNSYATGNVYLDLDSYTYNVGGLVGNNLGTIENSYATGNVNGTDDYVGGLIGYTEGNVLNSYATGNVNATGYSAGGLVGYSYYADISNSYATGNVSSSGEQVGGLVGYLDEGGVVNNSYAIGDVIGIGGHVGGLVGYSLSTISNSYSTGDVTTTGNYIGGLVGLNDAVISNSYWYNSTANSALNCYNGGDDNCTAVDSEEYFYNYDNPPMNLTAGDGWDFINIWDDVYNGTDYPVLQWQNASLLISFVSPTPDDGNVTTDNSVYVNVSTNSDISSVVMDWNNSLAGWWRFNSEDDMTDYSTYGNNGTNYGTTWTSEGKLGGAADFDGENGYVDLGDLTVLKNVSQFSISLWVNQNQLTGNNPTLFSKYYNDTESIQLATFGVPPYDQIFLLVGSEDNNLYGMIDNDIFSAGDWYHVVGVVDLSQSSDEDRLKIYIDGIQRELSFSGTAPTLTSAESSNAELGRYAQMSYFLINGSIDDVQIYSRALSESEVLAIYNATANQYENNFEDLDNGNYTYIAYGQKEDGNVYSTEQRTVEVQSTIDTCAGVSAPTADEDEDGYIEVTNCCELQLINESLSDDYELNNTIDCSNTINWNDGAGFLPIASSGWFTGNLNGNNYMISNLYANSSSSAGLFYSLAGSVYNLSLENLSIISTGWGVGGLAAYVCGGEIETVPEIINVYSSGTIEGSGSVGGLIGDSGGECSNYAANISSSSSSVNVTCSGDYCGGLVGFSDGGNITNSFSIGNITATGGFVGGLVGYSNTGVSNSYATGNIYSESEYVGGLVGYLYEGGIVNNAYARGNVDAASGSVGGLIGDCYGIINNSYSTGNVSGDYAGGLVGNLYGGAYNSFSTGQVASAESVGGLVGDIFYSEGVIVNSYWYNRSDNISCYGTNGVEGAEGNENCTAISNLEYFYNYDNPPMNLSTEEGWDFATVWSDAYDGTDYPVFQWQNASSSDEDSDGITDGYDKLYYNESNVNTTGLTTLNITVGGNSTNGSYYSGNYEIDFYDGSTLLINFTHNFTNSTLDLSKVTINKATNSIMINLSGQLQSGYKKTIYLADNNFISLCVKDAEIASISEISSGCDGTNETDFTACLGGSLTTDGIICTDLGSTIKIENLSHSGALGVPATSGPSSSSSSSSGGSGGGCLTNWTCSEWSSCSNGTQTRTCSKDLTYCYAGPQPEVTQNCGLSQPTGGNKNETVIPIKYENALSQTVENAVSAVKSLSWQTWGIATGVVIIFALIIFLFTPKKKHWSKNWKPKH